LLPGLQSGVKLLNDDVTLGQVSRYVNTLFSLHSKKNKSVIKSRQAKIMSCQKVEYGYRPDEEKRWPRAKFEAALDRLQLRTKR